MGLVVEDPPAKLRAIAGSSPDPPGFFEEKPLVDERASRPTARLAIRAALLLASVLFIAFAISFAPPAGMVGRNVRKAQKLLSIDNATIAIRGGGALNVAQPRNADGGATAPADDVGPPPKVAKEMDLAVCFVGAVRTFAEPDVVENLRKVNFPGETAFFHYLFVGEELSLRGQNALGAEHAAGMARALSNSTAFRLQYQENEFTCDQMSTGKFHKMAACAKMVEEYSRHEGVVFKSIAFTRPDLRWNCPFFPFSHHTIHLRLPANVSDWYVRDETGDELLTISGSEASRGVAMRVNEAQCCDMELRFPKGCFVDGLKEPVINYIQHRHFASQLENIRAKNTKCKYMIRRSHNASVIIYDQGYKGLHGKYRPSVLRCSHPQLSPVVTAFPSLPFEERKQMLEDLLSVPYATTCANQTVASGKIQTGNLAGVQNASTDTNSIGSILPQSLRFPGRFPRYGSPEFATACRWAMDDGTKESTNSTSRASMVPWVRNSEGFSSWICAIAQAYIYGRRLAPQNHGVAPRLLLELDGMNVSAVFQPPDARDGNAGWAVAPQTASSAYQWCESAPDCRTVHENQPWDRAQMRGRVPLYRHAYTDLEDKWLHEGDYDHLIKALPAFSVETGMACALNSMFEPSPKLSDQEPDLFTRLLPELRGEDTLVLSLYLRTQMTDLRISQQNETVWDEGADRQAWLKEADEFLQPFVRCAQQLEQVYFSDSSAISDIGSRSVKAKAPVSKIIWMVSSDSLRLKQHVRDTFQRDVAIRANAAASGTKDTSHVSVRRNVVYSGAEGMHTRYDAHPSHAATAQAFVDWYLLGESDAVIAEDGRFSFGATAALRTARPLYYVPRPTYVHPTHVQTGGPPCARQMLIHPKP